MCDCDLERPAVYSELYRKARTSHVCGECSRHINKGEHYYNISGLWDGEFLHFKQCISCHELFTKLSAMNICVSLGGLEQELIDSEIDVNELIKL